MFNLSHTLKSIYTRYIFCYKSCFLSKF